MHALACRARAVLALAAAALVLTACGGSDAPPAGTTPPPPADVNHVPVPIITVAATGTAGQALAFDASASSDADGDALVYSWSFGDGAHGGGAKLAHVFAAAGPAMVTLTVSDGKGGIATASQPITVAAGPAAGPSAPVTGYIGDANGPLAGVVAQQQGGRASATSDAAGKLSLALPTGVPVVLHLGKSGYADQTVALQLPPGAPNAMFKAGMLLREAAVDFDAGAGGSVVGKDGATVVFPAGALVDPSGNAVTGTAQIAITPVDVRDAGAALFPGAFTGIDANAAAQPIASHGTTEFVITQGGQKLQLAAGATASIELPIYAALHLDGSTVAVGDVIPLWSLDETSGQWVQEGTGNVVASAASPSGLAMQAQVGHFSWWNGDTLLNPPGAYDTLPQCYYSAGPEFPTVTKPCSIGPLLPGEYRVTNSAAGRRHALDAPPPGFQRTPSYAARADIPAEGGITLPVPSGIDFTLYACSDGGLYCGQTTVHGAAGASEAVRIDLFALTQAGCGTPAAVSLPVSQDYAIPDVGVASCFTFHLDAGQVVTFGVAPNTASSLNGRFELFDPSGNSVDAAIFSPSTAHAAAPRRIATTSGSYKLVVTAAPNSPVGGFTLTVAQGAPTVLAVPTVAATYDTPTRTDFVFPIDAGQMLAASVRDHSYYGSAVSLVDGTSAAFSPSAFDTYYAAFTFTAVADSEVGFTVLPGQLTGDSHPKSIVSIAPMLPLTVGSVATGAIASGGEVKSYAFAGNAGDIVFATALTDASGTGQLRPYLRMLGPQAQDLASTYATSTGWRVGPFTLAASGTYRLDALTNPSYATSGYGLRVSPVAAPTPVVPTGTATTVNGSIDAIGDLRYYTVTLAQGDVIRMSVNSPAALGLALDVLGPDTATPFYARTAVNALHLETVDATDDTYNNHDAYTLMVPAPQSGDYTVRVMGNSSRLVNALGAFSFTLDRPVAAALAASTTLSDTLDAPYGAKRYAVTIAAPGDYRFCVISPAWVQDELRDSTGTSLVQTTNRSIGSFSSPEFVKTLAAGTYTLDVFQRDKGVASYSIVYRPAGDAHPACQ